MPRSFIKILAAAAAMLGLCGTSVAQDFPTKPLRFIVPHSAGGGTDVVARVFAEKMRVGLGQPVIVENKVGGGSQVGAEYVAGSASDGYTMLFTSSSVLTLPYLRQTKFELSKDFVPIGQIGTGGFVFVVRPDFPANTFAEFIALAKNNKPGAFTYGSAGVGSANHLAMELLKSKVGIDLTHVPYRGSGDMAQALMSGQIDTAIDVLITEKDLIKAKKVRGLATAGTERDPDTPDLPTINETRQVPGGYEMTFWFGVFVPSQTPAPIVERLRKEFATVMKDPDVLKRVKSLALSPSTMSPAQFQAAIVAEQDIWKKVITQNGIRLE